MKDIVMTILGYTAIALIGCLCGFFMVLNWIKQEERKDEHNNGKTSR